MIYRALFGLLLLCIGLFVYRNAYELARLNERVDAIGSSRAWEEVEPAPWLVFLYRLGAVIGAAIGAAFLLAAAYALL